MQKYIFYRTPDPQEQSRHGNFERIIRITPENPFKIFRSDGSKKKCIFARQKFFLN